MTTVDPGRDYKIQTLREERERIERRLYDDQQRLRDVFLELVELGAFD